VIAIQAILAWYAVGVLSYIGSLRLIKDITLGECILAIFGGTLGPLWWVAVWIITKKNPLKLVVLRRINRHD